MARRKGGRAPAPKGEKPHRPSGLAGCRQRAGTRRGGGGDGAVPAGGGSL